MKYIGLMVFMGVIVLLNACCQQKKCNGVNDLNEIQLIHFTLGEANSMVVESYVRNSDFHILVDSYTAVIEDSQTNDSSVVVYMGSSLDINFDYQIIFPVIHQTYFLTDFSVKERECNACFPLGHNHYNELESYLVNGVKQNLWKLQISKSH